jgi:ACS family hexuronate transporter-like MFS transporter
VVAEWIPIGRRSTAMGIINAGTAVGSVLAPPLNGILLLTSGWRMVFFVSGAVGLGWVVWWYFGYRSSSEASEATLDARAVAQELSFFDLVSMRPVQVLIFAKFMSDSALYFYLLWLPKYLYDAQGFDIKEVSYFAWIPYAASGIGSFLGGWLSSALLSRGRSLVRAGEPACRMAG